MQVTVLFIIYRDQKHITLHDNYKQASQTLHAFIDERWKDHFRGEPAPATATAEERIDLFFAGDGDLYVLGRADLSELDARLEAEVGECPSER